MNFQISSAYAAAVAYAANLVEISTCICVKVRVMFTFDRARLILEPKKKRRLSAPRLIRNGLFRISQFPMRRHITPARRRIVADEAEK